MNILQTYVTRLHRVHASGCSSIHLEPVPVAVESLDPRFVFVLDTGLKIFMWHGKKSKNTFKSKARYSFLQGHMYLGVFFATVEPRQLCMHNDECRPGVQFVMWVDISLLPCQDGLLDPPSPLSGMYQRCSYVVMQLGHKTDLSGVSNC